VVPRIWSRHVSKTDFAVVRHQLRCVLIISRGLSPVGDTDGIDFCRCGAVPRLAIEVGNKGSGAISHFGQVPDSPHTAGGHHARHVLSTKAFTAVGQPLSVFGIDDEVRWALVVASNIGCVVRANEPKALDLCVKLVGRCA
jgi:hypothetical protein